jgi:hypothetical protein
MIRALSLQSTMSEFVEEIWWSQAGSNRRPLACHASALPAELWPRLPVTSVADDGSFAGLADNLPADASRAGGSRRGAAVWHISSGASSARERKNADFRETFKSGEKRQLFEVLTRFAAIAAMGS